MKEIGICVSATIVSDEVSIISDEAIHLCDFKESDTEYLVVIAVGENYQNEIRQNLGKYGIDKYISLNEGIRQLLDKWS